MVWYSYLFKNFPQFVVIHTVKGFSIVKESEVHVFLEFSWYLYDPVDVGSLIYLFQTQLVHLEVLGSCTAEACLERF